MGSHNFPVKLNHWHAALMPGIAKNNLSHLLTSAHGNMASTCIPVLFIQVIQLPGIVVLVALRTPPVASDDDVWCNADEQQQRHTTAQEVLYHI